MWSTWMVLRDEAHRQIGGVAQALGARTRDSLVWDAFEEVDEGLERLTLALGELRKHEPSRERLRAAVFAEEE